MIVKIPKTNLNGNASDMRSFLSTWQWRTKPSDAILTLDFTANEFIEPWALTLFAAYALNMKQIHGVKVEVILSESPSNKYVRQMGFAEIIETGESTAKWDKSEQNTGLHVLRSHADVSRFVDSASLLGAQNETLDALRYGMAELGRNVIQHSQSGIGGIAMAQYFPEREAIQVSVADAGQGVFESLRVIYPELKNDLESLKLSVLPHASGAFPKGAYFSSDNAGLGLFFSKEICWRSGGSFWIVSNKALLGVSSNDVAGTGKIYRDINPWSGTSVTMDIPAKGVEDFGALLSLCQELSAKARSASGVAGLDFVSEAPTLEGARVIMVGDLSENIEAAAKIRENEILPAVKNGESIVLDFTGARFITQSFAHALLNDAFKIPGSLLRLSFINCTKSTKEAIITVAAYAASYKQIV